VMFRLVDQGSLPNPGVPNEDDAGQPQRHAVTV
jgi:hypothetical protein